MAEEDAESSVRDRISVLVDAQEGGGGMQPYGVGQKEEVNKSSINSRKKLKVMLLVMVILMIGIVTIILSIKLLVDNSEYGDVDYDNQSGVDSDEIINVLYPLMEETDLIARKLENDSAYTKEDAKKDFEQLMSNSSGNGRVNVAFRYSAFIYNYCNDAEQAVKILESVKDDVSADYKEAYDDYYSRYKREMNKTSGVSDEK